MGNRMGNYIRAVRELPKLKNQLEVVRAKRIEAERHLKLLQDDLSKTSETLEQQRLNAIKTSSATVEHVKKTMEIELKAAQEETKKLEQLGGMRLENDKDEGSNEGDDKVIQVGRGARRGRKMI